MTFGLTNAPATFQRYMNYVLRDHLNTWAKTYLDDILIHTTTREEHLERIRQTLTILREKELYAKLSKCSFAETSVEYLGHIIDKNEVRTDPTKIKAVAEWPCPKSVVEIQQFLELANYYQRFVYQFFDIARPLSNLTKKGTQFIWTKECQEAFLQLKASLCCSLCLRIFDSALPTRTQHDASKYAISRVLYQQHKERWHPIAYHSRKLKGPELNYDTYNKEFLAVTDSLKIWRHYLLGREFELQTDHNSVVYIPNQKHLTAHQVRAVELLVEYRFKPVHITGKSNAAADALSRRPDYVTNNTEVTPFSEMMSGIEAAYASDEDFKEIYAQCLENPNHKEYRILNGFLRRFDKLCIPQGPYQPLLLHHAHDSITAGHPGVKKTYTAIAEEYWWPSMRKDIEQYVKCCDSCQRVKKLKKAPYGVIPASTTIQKLHPHHYGLYYCVTNQ